MTNPQPKNIATSVHQRLQNKAKEANRSFNELFQYYAIERFLYRLSLSTHAERFVLKGALMLMVWESPLFRSTMDIDVLGRMENSIGNIISIVQEVCSQEAEPDGHHQNLCDTADRSFRPSGRLHAGLRAGRHESCSMEGFPAQEPDGGDTRRFCRNSPDHFCIPDADRGEHHKASTCAGTLEIPRALEKIRQKIITR